MVYKNAALFTSDKYRNIKFLYNINEYKIRITRGDTFSTLLITSNANDFRNKYSSLSGTRCCSLTYSKMSIVKGTD